MRLYLWQEIQGLRLTKGGIQPSLLSSSSQSGSASELHTVAACGVDIAALIQADKARLAQILLMNLI